MLQTCCATRCWTSNVIWKEICVAWLVWKPWGVTKETPASVKRAKGDIAHPFSWCGGRLCLLSAARWYANAPCRIWMNLKPVLSCQQEIQDMFSTLGVMQLGQTYLSFANTSATDNSSWDFVDASARKSEVAISKTKTWTRCHVTWYTVVGLGCYHMTCTMSFQNWMQWHTISAIECS